MAKKPNPFAAKAAGKAPPFGGKGMAPPFGKKPAPGAKPFKKGGKAKGC
jgi:hypothetical protein